MGCCLSAEEHAANAAKQGPVNAADFKRVEAPADTAELSVTVPRVCSKRGTWKKNQVVPDPELVELLRRDSSPAAPSQTALQYLHSPSVTHQQSQRLVETGLTSWESRQCALTKRWQPFIDELQDISSCVQADRCLVVDSATRMTNLLRRAPEWLDMATSAEHQDAVCMLEACSNAACQLANSVLQPIALHAERSLTQHQASLQHGSLPRSMRWDTLDVDQLLGALQAGCQEEYGMELAAASQPAQQAAELLVMLQQHSAKNAKLHAKAFGSMVPAVDKIVSMLGIVFFKRVVLEEQDALQTKMSQLAALQDALGWADHRQLAVCLQPHSRAMLAGLHQACESGGELPVKFQVRRGHAFWDSLQQAIGQGMLPACSSSNNSTGTKCYKLFPSFVDEWTSETEKGKVVLEAGEGHGPRKEFFALAAAGMTCKPSTGEIAHAVDEQQQGRQERQQQPCLFTYNRSGGAFWFNSNLVLSDSLRQAFYFAGWLMGQSIINKAPLEVPLAPVMLRMLLEGLDAFAPDLETLESFDPDAASSLRNVAALPRDQLRGMMEIEGLALDTTAEQYIQRSVLSLLMESVQWQAQALIAGFRSAINVQVLQTWCIDANTLAMVLNEGGDTSDTTDIDIRKIFRVVMDDELANGAILGELFWDVVNTWPRERKLQFLQFVTGSARLPLPGSELLKIEAPFVALGAAEHKAQLGMLPQAHTCDNLLELPNYWEALIQVKGYRSTAKVPKDKLPSLKEDCVRILNERLTIAVTCCSGYGLDRRNAESDD